MLDPRAVFSRLRAFTIIEMLVTLMIIAVISAFLGTMFLESRSQARAVRCLSNQQQISNALVCFYTDHKTFPADHIGSDLALELKDYIPWPEARRGISLPEVWHCPNDRSGPLDNSYQDYYVAPIDLHSPDRLVLGCPRHQDVNRSFITTQGVNYTSRSNPGHLHLNGTIVSQEAPAHERTIASGSMHFDDASSATITSTSADYRVTAVASFRMDSGRLYTIVRVAGSGDAKFSVTPGSKFEVITPVAIIGVRGTQFDVRTSPDYTRIVLTQGRVWVYERAPKKTYELSAPATLQIGTKPATGKPRKLMLRCVYRGIWRLENPNDFNVFFRWDDYNDGEDGCGVVPADGTTYFYTYEKTHRETVRVFHALPGYGLVCTVKSSNNKPSPPPGWDPDDDG